MLGQMTERPVMAKLEILQMTNLRLHIIKNNLTPRSPRKRSSSNRSKSNEKNGFAIIRKSEGVTPNLFKRKPTITD